MAPSTFGERLGFAGWLYHLRTGRAPTNTAVADVVGRSSVTIGSWYVADEAPSDWKVHEPLARFFELDERWLVRGEGEPPQPALWPVWVQERRGEAPRTAHGIKKEHGKPVGTRQRADAAKKGGGRKRPA